ncbi:hypothetical protein P691DRAFT_95307 [Macrolepiota fuliginosa MF-IS2]|uniref:Uncharacterized protein n=1 Tax=Macrolepiota fuliginosa MF-IS2 TaxID=1400762 RepID=A0A9P5WZ22_9AGAR|nr:hypothetical protein P691DRAFT_95307 [Macrolepiota fuliginosa MF-IS2]
MTDFDVTGATSNSPLNIAFNNAWLNSTLALETSTWNSPAEATLHLMFESRFSLQSSLFILVIHSCSLKFVGSLVEDPTGKGRRHYIKYGNVRNYVSGDVSWDSGHAEGNGEANIRSPKVRVMLNLQIEPCLIFAEVLPGGNKAHVNHSITTTF